jgi:hypothetical protein
LIFLSSLTFKDEIQVAEMPSLGHLKQALLSRYRENEGYYNIRPKTRMSRVKSSPILIHGIERLCEVKLDRKYVKMSLKKKTTL